MATKFLILPHDPSHQSTYQLKEYPIKSGFVVAAVVIDPSPNDGVIHPGQIRYVFVASPV
jgi:hypothetical protein